MQTLPPGWMEVNCGSRGSGSARPGGSSSAGSNGAAGCWVSWSGIMAAARKFREKESSHQHTSPAENVYRHGEEGGPDQASPARRGRVDAARATAPRMLPATVQPRKEAGTRVVSTDQTLAELPCTLA